MVGITVPAKQYCNFNEHEKRAKTCFHRKRKRKGRSGKKVFRQKATVLYSNNVAIQNFAIFYI